MKTIYAFFLICILACSSPNSESKTEQKPPNIILIIADDMAWDDCGAYGHPSIKTPNIDQLAKDGMIFHNAFLTTSSCSPSRASIITGTYPHQTDAEQLHWSLPGDKITFVEKLKAFGYWTAQAGKWHFGDAIKDRFDLIAPVGTSGFVYDPNKKEERKINQEDGSGCDQWLATLKKRPADKPFFLWLAAVDPHRPYDESQDPSHHMVDVRVPPYLPDNEIVRADFVRYYDEIFRMDKYIGEVIAELDNNNLSENTLVLFISDNGRPFPREKTTLYDGGIKTPWIVKWPLKVKAGGQTKALVSSVDIATTFLSLAKGSQSSEASSDSLKSFEGENFTEVLFNSELPLRDFIYAEDHWHDFEDYGRAVRTVKYKYIKNYYEDLANTPPADALRSPTFRSMQKLRDEQSLNVAQSSCFLLPRPIDELYDIVEDPHELHNLATDPSYQEVLMKMQNHLQSIRASTNDLLPKRRTKDEFDRETGVPLSNRKRPRDSKLTMTQASGSK